MLKSKIVLVLLVVAIFSTDLALFSMNNYNDKVVSMQETIPLRANSTIKIIITEIGTPKLILLNTSKVGKYSVNATIVAHKNISHSVQIQFITGAKKYYSFSNETYVESSIDSDSYTFDTNVSWSKDFYVQYPTEFKYYMEIYMTDGVGINISLTLEYYEAMEFAESLDTYMNSSEEKTFGIPLNFGIYNMTISTNGSLDITVFSPTMLIDDFSFSLNNETKSYFLLFHPGVYYLHITCLTPNTLLKINFSFLNFTTVYPDSSKSFLLAPNQTKWVIIPIKLFQLYSIDLDHNQDGWSAYANIRYFNDLDLNLYALIKSIYNGKFYKLSYDKFFVIKYSRTYYSITDSNNYYFYIQTGKYKYDGYEHEYEHVAEYTSRSYKSQLNEYLVVELSAYNFTDVPESNINVTLTINTLDIEEGTTGNIKIELSENTTWEFKVLKYQGNAGDILNVTFIKKPYLYVFINKKPWILFFSATCIYSVLNSEITYLILYYKDEVEFNVTIQHPAEGNMTLKNISISVLKLPRGGAYDITIESTIQWMYYYSPESPELTLYVINSKGEIQHLSDTYVARGKFEVRDYYIDVYHLADQKLELRLKLQNPDEEYYLVAILRIDSIANITVTVAKELQNEINTASFNGLLIGIGVGIGIGFIAAYAVAILQRKIKKIKFEKRVI